ncbi:hypothetical protein [Legionella oakridgensis]|uniref:Uncharacterized protein n=2 Tax=Legionella oakridgensis TaxID=29423 RepID=W0BFM5_9GAMM|nr:hypothetical protein [Legionella oakridgensis]AHE67427.1 hypothetical protein Loa_01880 [Legionella oakridgensis ATCC 33761 = DSM 21215]ETO92959.1 hypothetical protein LOR_44c06860 [Legionella oakridgensis RV-2-2007]KTD43487.1 Chromosome partition protein Smc [Legionella oakridgensis]STY20479.1 Uncharacterised protein [Legionella longbeachae]
MRHEVLLVTLEDKPQGFTDGDMRLFATLDAVELRAMAQHRSLKANRTILHRLVLTEGACPEEIKEQFFRNLATLLSLMKPVLTEDDTKRLTHHVLITANVPYVKELVRTATELELEVFSNRAVIATHLDSQEYSHRAMRCRELGITVPTKEEIRRHSQKVLRTEVAVASVSVAPVVAEKESEFLREMLLAVESKLARVEREKTTAAEELRKLQEQHAETQALLGEAQERLAKVDGLDSELAREKEQRETVQAQLQRTRAKLQQAKDREALLNDNLDKANEKAASLEDELAQAVAEARELQRLNQQLTVQSGEFRRRERATTLQLEHAQRAQTLLQQGMTALAMANGATPEISEGDVVSAAARTTHRRPAAREDLAEAAAASFSGERMSSRKRSAAQPSDDLELDSRQAPTAAAPSVAHSSSSMFASRKRAAASEVLPEAPEFKRVPSLL